MKNLIRLSIAAALLAATAAKAEYWPEDPRRTLFASAGQRTVILEAPIGMCFLNARLYQESVLFSHLQKELDKTASGLLLGIFAPCAEASGVAQGAGGDGLESARATGLVIWLASKDGAEEKMTPADYLDMQEAAFRDRLEKSLGADAAQKLSGADAAPKLPGAAPAPGNNDTLAEALAELDRENLPAFASEPPAPAPPVYNMLMLPAPGEYRFDAAPRRTQHGVTIGFDAETNRDYIKRSTTGIAGTALLNKVPVEVRLSYTQKTPRDKRELEALMDKFLEQQAALNK